MSYTLDKTYHSQTTRSDSLGRKRNHKIERNMNMTWFPLMQVDE